MRRSLLLTAVLLLLAADRARAERDPEYDAVLKAYTDKRYGETVSLAEAFLAAKPTYRYAHSVRYMRARSLYSLNRLPEAEEAFREYMKLHAAAKYADRCRCAFVQTLNADGRHEAALAEADAYRKAFPEGKSASRVAFERAFALESLRRFPEAASAYRRVEGVAETQARFRVGVALFRGREFRKAAEALRIFIEAYPTAKWRRSAEDYLFRCETGFGDIRDGIVHDYSGKYETDLRLAAVRKTLAKRRTAALGRIRKLLGVRVPRTFLIRFADAGRDRSGNYATTRLEVVRGEPRHVVVLYTEYLVMGAYDLDRTLTHELYHCLQRARLGEDHFLVPKWAREGAALFVAGQEESRTRLLAAEVGRRRNVDDPMRLLVNGLDGRHRFEDYAEDVAAFAAVEERHGKAKTVKLLRKLLATHDVEAAIGEVLGESFETFEKAASARARARLTPLLEAGRAELLDAIRLGREKDWEGMQKALPAAGTVYDPVVAYYRALTMQERDRHEEALRAIREGYLAKHREFTTFTDNALHLELRILAAMESDEFADAADRAVRDLEPTGAFNAVRKLLADLAPPKPEPREPLPGDPSRPDD